MTSYEDITPPDDAQKDQSKKISFRFCRECSNMLYPMEDEENSTLLFGCRNCQSSEAADAACVYRNALKEEIAETAGNVDDVAQDPTVGNSGSPIVGDDDDDAMYDSVTDVDMTGEEEVPQFCTLCGNEILCPFCGNPSMNGMVLETTDPGAADNPQKEQEQEELERRERALSGAGLPTS